MAGNASKHFCAELDSLIERFRHEYDMSYAEAIGCLELIKADLVEECRDVGDDDEGGDPDEEKWGGG